MTKKILQLLFLFFYIINFSQSYIPIDTADRPKRDVFVKNFEFENESFIKNIKEQYSGKEGREIRKIYEEFGKDFIKEIKEGKFIFKDDIIKKVQEIIQNLKQNNVIIPTNIKLLISKDGSLNAFCLADGTFVINLGLYYWLENEDQMAGIIAHELAHRILNHSLKAIENQVRLENSKGFLQKVEDIKSQKFNKSTTAFSIFKKIFYENGIKSRKAEYEADSLGYLLLKNTKYNKSEFVNALSLSAKYDTIKPKGLTKEIYAKTFNFPKLPFNEKWMDMEDFSSYNYNLYKEKLDKDSISTHPEMVERITRLKRIFPELNAKFKTAEADENYKKFQKNSGI